MELDFGTPHGVEIGVSAELNASILLILGVTFITPTNEGVGVGGENADYYVKPKD